MENIYLQDGQIIKNPTGSVAGLFNINKFIKRDLTYLNVPFGDPCCLEDLTTFPVRFNATTGGFERLNTSGIYVAADDSTESVGTGITAFAGGTQAPATPLTALYNNVTVSASNGDSVKLMVAAAGTHQTIINNGASSIDIFPVSGSSIDGVTDGNYRLATGATVTFTAINATTWLSDKLITGLKNGSVSIPSLTFNSDTDTGIYNGGPNVLGLTAGGAAVVTASSFGLNMVAGYITQVKPEIIVPTPVARNATITLTATDMLSGYITSTSAAATNLTTTTATLLATAMGATAGVAVARGTAFEFSIDNTAGANTVTLVLDASIAITTPVITGTNTLTISVANGIGRFRLVFTSGTTAKIFRLF